MRIAQVSPLVFPVPQGSHGAAERVVGYLTDGLMERGHDVTLFAAEGSHTSARLDPQGPALAVSPQASASLLAARECAMLDNVARQAERFDIIHCHTDFHHAAALRHVAHKLVTTVHGRADGPDRQAYFDHFEDLSVVGISRAQAEQIPDRNLAGVVHHGIAKDRFRMGAGRDDYCAYLAPMTPRYRSDRAIGVAKRSRVKLQMAGAMEASQAAWFDAQVKPQLNKSLQYIGPATDVQKQMLLGNASVFLFPTDWPDPFGLVMVEAMACGTPVIAWDHPSASDIIEDGVSGFIVTTMEEAVSAMEQARKLDRHGVRDAFERRFTADHMARGYEGIYGDLLETGQKAA